MMFVEWWALVVEEEGFGVICSDLKLVFCSDLKV